MNDLKRLLTWTGVKTVILTVALATVVSLAQFQRTETVTTDSDLGRDAGIGDN